jgi:hypothetical protein
LAPVTAPIGGLLGVGLDNFFIYRMGRVIKSSQCGAVLSPEDDPDRVVVARYTGYNLIHAAFGVALLLGLAWLIASTVQRDGVGFVWTGKGAAMLAGLAAYSVILVYLIRRMVRAMTRNGGMAIVASGGRIHNILFNASIAINEVSAVAAKSSLYGPYVSVGLRGGGAMDIYSSGLTPGRDEIAAHIRALVSGLQDPSTALQP